MEIPINQSLIHLTWKQQKQRKSPIAHLNHKQPVKMHEAMRYRRRHTQSDRPFDLPTQLLIVPSLPTRLFVPSTSSNLLQRAGSLVLWLQFSIQKGCVQALLPKHISKYKIEYNTKYQNSDTSCITSLQVKKVQVLKVFQGIFVFKC